MMDSTKGWSYNVRVFIVMLTVAMTVALTVTYVAARIMF